MNAAVEQSGRSCVIIGAGGHARVLIDCLKTAAWTGPIVALDHSAERHGSDFHGVRIVGGDDQMRRLGDEGYCFLIGLGTTGESDRRTTLFAKAVDAGLIPLTAIHPSATIAEHTEIDDGTQIFAGTIVNPGVRIGANSIVNTGAVIDHDCHIGRNVHVAPGACLGGAVSVGDGAHVGIGAVVLNGISIGASSVIGAGAVVIRDVAPRTTVVGNPAKPIRNTLKD